MVRLIPWALPTIPGDSEGGYTPQPTPGPVHTDLYDFTNARVTAKDTQAGGTMENAIAVERYSNASNKIDKLVGDLWVSGIAVIDSYGASSMACLIDAVSAEGGAIQVRITVDIETLAIVTKTLVTKSGNISKYREFMDCTQYHWYVYSGDGSIIQETVIEVA